jgi:phosphatidylglycerophosphate synthase
LARLLVPTGIGPNAVSVTGVFFVWAAAWAYATLEWPVGALLGFGLHMAWHVIDGADGDLARLTGRASPTGEMVDGLCDYAAHVVLYITLAAMLDDEVGVLAWILAAAAGASHAFQTNHAESHRRNYLWWAYGVPWLKHAQSAGDEVFRARNAVSRMFVWLTRLYLAVAHRMAPWSDRMETVVDLAVGDPHRVERVRRLVRRASRRSLLLEKLVGPNPRAILLGISMLAGSPIWYFLAEVVLLNLVLGLSIVHHNLVGRRLAESLT